MTNDGPIVEEVRKRRAALLARFGGDLNLYFEHIRKMQERHKDRLVSQVTVVRASEKKPLTSRRR